MKATAILLSLTAVLSASVGVVAANERPRFNDLTGGMIDLDSHVADLVITPAVRTRDGIEIIIHRLTSGRYMKKPDGSDDADKLFKDRARQIAAAKIRLGAYHFLWTAPDGRDNGVEQARGFFAALKEKCVPGQKTLLAVDWEPIACKNKPCPIPDPSILATFIKTVRAATGKPVLVYTSNNVLDKFADRIAPDTELGQTLTANPLWFAKYERPYFLKNTESAEKKFGYIFPARADVRPWKDWTFWQFAPQEDSEERAKTAPTGNISLKINNARADLNFFAGRREDLIDFYERHAVICDKIAMPETH